MKALACALLCLAATAAWADGPQLLPSLAGAGFLVGNWASGKGHVGDAGSYASGTSSFGAAAGGSVLLRRDHTDLFDKNGHKIGGFDQLMFIYPEGGTLRAEYADGTHVIHYGSGVVTAGKSVVFTSVPQPGAPTFRLSYTVTAPDAMDVAFAVIGPGQTAYHDIATGTLHRKS